MNYIVAQLLGAGAAALCLKAVFGHSLLAGVTRVHMGVSLYNAFFIEGVMTFILIMSILTTRNPAIISIAGKRKLTAVCSHQTRIGNLDAHLI